MKKILIIYPSRVSFVRNDIELLGDQFLVKELKFGSGKGVYLVLNLFRSSVLYLIYFICGYRTNLIWFADYHSFFPSMISRIFGGNTHIIVGGYDVVEDEELKYGGHVKKHRSWIIKSSFKMAETLISVSDHVTETLEVDFGVSGSKIRTVYNACQLNEKKESKKESLVISVCIATSYKRLLIKGIDRYIKLAENLPNYTFVIVGISSKLDLSSMFQIPKNLLIKGKMPYDELTTYYKKAKLICQFSRYESFGLAVLEGISFGCIPLVSNIGGLPELVNNDDRFMIDVENQQEIKNKSKYLIDSYSTISTDVLLQNIKNKYGFEKRSNSLVNILNNAVV